MTIHWGMCHSDSLDDSLQHAGYLERPHLDRPCLCVRVCHPDLKVEDSDGVRQGCCDREVSLAVGRAGDNTIDRGHAS